MMDRKQIEQLIEDGLPGCRAMVKGDDGQHFEAEVLFPGFAGKSVVDQHRMVYAALGERMGKEIHALALRTRAPKAPCA